jgi:hypothetical protein
MTVYKKKKTRQMAKSEIDKLALFLLRDQFRAKKKNPSQFAFSEEKVF